MLLFKSLKLFHSKVNVNFVVSDYITLLTDMSLLKASKVANKSEARELLVHTNSSEIPQTIQSVWYSSHSVKEELLRVQSGLYLYLQTQGCQRVCSSPANLSNSC